MSKIEDKINNISKLSDKTSDLHPVQIELIENSLSNIQNIIEQKSSVFSIESNKMLLWKYAIENSKNEIFAIASNRGSSSGHGFSFDKDLLELQKTMINQGVKVHRIFSIREDQYNDMSFFELLKSQIKIGIDVWLIRDNITKYIYSSEDFDNENFVLVDQEILYRSYVEKGNMKNTLTFDSELLEKYTNTFKNLLEKSSKFDLKDLPKNFNEI